MWMDRSLAFRQDNGRIAGGPAQGGRRRPKALLLLRSTAGRWTMCASASTGSRRAIRTAIATSAPSRARKLPTGLCRRSGPFAMPARSRCESTPCINSCRPGSGHRSACAVGQLARVRAVSAWRPQSSGVYQSTHTGLVDIATGDWSRRTVETARSARDAFPPIVPAGTVVGKLAGPLAELPAFRDTDLIVPACHDTASAIAGIQSDLEGTAYICSGTWSLVGTLIPAPITTKEAMDAGFTNQGAACGRILLPHQRERHVDSEAVPGKLAQGRAGVGIAGTDSPGRGAQRFSGACECGCGATAAG